MVKNTAIYIVVLLSLSCRLYAQDIVIAQGVNVLVEFQEAIKEYGIRKTLDDTFMELELFEGGLLLTSMGANKKYSNVKGGNIIVACVDGHKYSLNITFADNIDQMYYYIENENALNYGRLHKTAVPVQPQKQILSSLPSAPASSRKKKVVDSNNYEVLMRPKCNVANMVGPINLKLGGIRIIGDTMTVGLFISNKSKVDFSKKRVVFAKGRKQKNKKVDYEMDTHNDIVMPFWSQEYDLIKAKSYEFYVFKFQKDVIDKTGFWNISITEESGDRGNELEVSGEQFYRCVIN